MVKNAKDWIPERQAIIWIDCNPQVEQEMRDIYPFLVLSPQSFNDKTSLSGYSNSLNDDFDARLSV